MKRKFLFFIFFILILTVFVYINMYEEFVHEKIKGFKEPKKEKIPIVLEYEPDAKIFSHKNKILIAGKSFVGLFNRKGDEIFKNSINFSDPIISKNSRYLLMADKNENQFFTLSISNGKHLTTKKSEDKIIGAALNEGDAFYIITEKKGFDSRTVFYDIKGELIHGWNAVENYITDAAISNDKSIMVLSAFEALGNNIKTGILKFRLNESFSHFEIKAENAIITNLTFKNSSLITVSDMFIDIDDNRIMFDDNKTLLDFYIDERISLLFQSKDLALNNYLVTTYKLDGKLDGSFEILNRPEIIKCKRNIIALVNKNEIAIYNKKGYLITKFFLPGQINDIAFGPFGLYALSNTELYLLKY